MVLRFLRFFGSFSDLELAVAELRAKNEALENCVEISRDEATTQANLTAAAEARVKDLQAMVDAYSMRVDRRYVFARTEAVPPAPSVHPIPSRRLGRDIVRESERNFEATMAELLREQTEAVLKQAE